MATVNREEVTTQLDSGMLFRLREIADREEREFHEVLEDAVDVYLRHRLHEWLGPEGTANLEAIFERMGRFQKMREQKSE